MQLSLTSQFKCNEKSARLSYWTANTSTYFCNIRCDKYWYTSIIILTAAIHTTMDRWLNIKQDVQRLVQFLACEALLVQFIESFVMDFFIATSFPIEINHKSRTRLRQIMYIILWSLEIVRSLEMYYVQLFRPHEFN